MIQVGPYQYENEDKLITQFKEIIKPKYSGGKSKFSDFTEQDEEEYNFLMPWLKQNNYVIDEFPNVIHQQPTLKVFGYDYIRSEILKENPADKVAWSDRRILIDSLHIKRADDFPVFSLDKELEEIISDVSNRRGSLHTQTIDDQLATLNNCIEYLLKKNGKYQNIPSSLFYDFFDEQKIKQFREDTHIFRHSSKESIKEREYWSKTKKHFYIRLGILVVSSIYLSRK